MNKSYDYTGAKRQGVYRQRLKEKGLRQVNVWAYPEDAPAIRDHAAALRERREAVMDQGVGATEQGVDPSEGSA